MLKIGMVGGAKSWHAKSFSEMFNGYDEFLARQHNFPLYKSRIEGARVTHIWDPDREAAELIARICSIENVVDDMEEMIGKIDGVIIADDTTMKHQKRAVPFLEAGLPTFVDKPLSPSIEEAEELVNIAKKHNAPFMSCSALRYAKEVEEFLAQKDDLGEILTGNSICSGDLIFYGIHAMEQLYVCIGPGIKSVQNVGEEGKDIVIINKNDGRKFVLTVYKEISYLFQMNLYGTKGWREVRVEDSDYFYSNMLKAFIRMVESKKPPFPPEETLEIIKTLVLARHSAQRGGERIYL
ncbi:Gfo/Idh/MocA family oxidoreductase [bacterium]|nr:Gfo/Idh/MocA family oxidoreductase [bacterium]